MNQQRPKRLAVAIFAALGVLTACEGAPRVRVTSQPETARVYVNGNLVGSTPTDVALPFDEGERVYVQVVHPSGKLATCQVFTQENLPQNGEVNVDLR